MKVSIPAPSAVGLCATVGMLAGCSGSSAPITPQSVASAWAQHNGTVAVHPPAFHSWMDASAKHKNLLYITTAHNNEVAVYSYPKAKLLGTLTGFNFPEGECVDNSGDVWIADNALSRYGPNLFEYAHGGTSPIATLTDVQYYPNGCSVDPTTGNLAVAEEYGRIGSGAFAIYKHAKGRPKQFTDPNIYTPFFCAFDNEGNLFVNGFSKGSDVEFAELPKGSKTFTNLTLNETIYWPGGIQWDGTYLAVGDQDNPIIYEFMISGNSGTEVSSTPLDGTSDVAQFFILGEKVVASEPAPGTVGFWNYPQGGAATKLFSVGNEPVGTAVSMAK